MVVNPTEKQSLIAGVSEFNNLCNGSTPFEIKKLSNSRTSKQNRALHLYFRFISDELNNLGLEFHYQGLKINNLSSRYTEHIVKEFIWRPIQVALFDVDSTSKINTIQMNEIIDVITKHFAEKGIYLAFPSIETLI